MAIRYVIDPAVAQNLLAREPHLKSVITVEEYNTPRRRRGQLDPKELDALLLDAVQGPLGEQGIVVDAVVVEKMSLSSGHFELRVKILG